LHDLLRAYAAHLTHTEDSEDQRHTATYRLLDHYLHSAYAANRLLQPTRDPITLTPPQPGVTFEHPVDYQRALDWFTTEYPVLLAVVDHAGVAGVDTYTWQLVWTLTTFLHRQGHWQDQATTSRAALAAARRLADPTAQTRAHRGLAYAYTRLGRLDDAHTQLSHALDLATRADPTEQAHTHQTLAVLWARRGDPAQGLDHAQHSLDLFEAAGNQAGQADALNSVGWLHALLGHHQQALTYCQRALTLHEDLGYRGGQATTWDSLGYAHHHLGHHTEAVTCYRNAIDMYRNLGNRWEEADTLTRLGDSHHGAGDPTAARHAYQEALTILDDLDHPDADSVRTKLANLDIQSQSTS
jgi:tetratricopeptide (TPR) repeat protein